MRYAKILKDDFNNGTGIGVTLFVQGCPIHCPGCFNAETWDFSGGKLFKEENLVTILEHLNKKHISKFSILGGEPLAPEQDLAEIFNILINVRIAYPNLKIWLYTGYTWEQLQERIQQASQTWQKTVQDLFLKEILKNVDILVAGPFIQEKRDITLPWCGSRNQKIYLLDKGQIVKTLDFLQKK